MWIFTGRAFQAVRISEKALRNEHFWHARRTRRPV